MGGRLLKAAAIGIAALGVQTAAWAEPAGDTVICYAPGTEARSADTDWQILAALVQRRIALAFSPRAEGQSAEMAARSRRAAADFLDRQIAGVRERLRACAPSRS